MYLLECCALRGSTTCVSAIVCVNNMCVAIVCVYNTIVWQQRFEEHNFWLISGL